MSLLVQVADQYILFDYHTSLILSKKAEQLKIGEVLTKMRKYFENEVLVRSEYAQVRDRWYVPNEKKTVMMLLQQICA